MTQSLALRQESSAHWDAALNHEHNQAVARKNLLFWHIKCTVHVKFDSYKVWSKGSVDFRTVLINAQYFLLCFFFFFLYCSCRKLKTISENVVLLVFFNVSFSVSPSKPSSSLVSSQGTAHSELNVFLSTQYYTIFLECCAITSWARLSLCTPCREPDRLKSSNSIFRHVVLSERWHCAVILFTFPGTCRSRGSLALKSEVYWCCLFVHQSCQTWSHACLSLPPPHPSPPPSPVWGLSVCVSISDTSPGLIPSLGDGANLSGETAD